VPILVDESLLFWHLVNEHHGKCSLDKLRNQLNTSDADVAIAFLCNLKQIKILQNNSDKWMSVTFVFFKGLRVCLNAKSGCTNKKCTFLHVCPDHITDSCQAGEQCRFGHSVRIPNNELCLQKCGIQDNCSNESILAIARCSNPVICAAYNGVGELHCHNPLQCIKFHVCNNYFRSRCLILDSQCSLGHEFTSEHNGRRLQLYEVNHLLKDEKTKKTLYRMILPFLMDFIKHSHVYVADKNNGEQRSETVEVSRPIALPRFASRHSQSAKTLKFHDNQCQLYEEHLCNECGKCSVRHDTLPYLWRVEDAGKWVAFDDSANIELAFCSPGNDTYYASYQVYIYFYQCGSACFLPM